MSKKSTLPVKPLTEHEKKLLDEGGLAVNETGLYPRLGCFECRQWFCGRILWRMQKGKSGKIAIFCKSCGQKLIKKGWIFLNKILYSRKLKAYSRE